MSKPTHMIDFDNTYTTSPEVYDRFIADLKANGHHAFIITMRCGNGHDSICRENREEVKVPGCSVIFTDMQPKLWYVTRVLGMRGPFIWHDDDVKCILCPKDFK
jgi:hypothetical protein